MKKFTFILFLLLSSTFIAYSSVPQNIAKIVAYNFVIEKGEILNCSADKIELIETFYNQDEEVMYLFNIANQGFVLVSASPIAHPILAFSFEYPFETNPALEAWLNGYVEQIIQHTQAETSTPPKNKRAWDHYTASPFEPYSQSAVVVGPLITTRWNQNKYYNTYCPWDVNAGPYYDYRVPNGCVALAFAQLMNYYRHPETGVGGASYLPSPYPRQTVHFNQHTYHWNAMTNIPVEYTNEIAKLVYHVGVSCQMGYSPDGSGAHTPLAAEKLVEHFRYSPDYRTTSPIEFVDEPELYVALLKMELDSLRPLVYSGRSEFGGGHAFLSDGYRDDNYFHFNWGWGGSGDGYFIHDAITFNQDVRVIRRMYPASQYPLYCNATTRLTASTGYITDGSTNKPYQTNPDCGWMVAVPTATSYSFTFDRFSLYPDVDFLTIYNGPSENDGVAHTFTGTTLPTGYFTVNADSVLIRFTTTDPNKEQHNYQGFLISYSSNPQDGDCALNTNLTYQVHATISDGSPNGENYKPSHICSWDIRPTFVTGYAFTFPRFELGLGDFIDIYDLTTTTPVFWKRFDLYNMPNFAVVNNAPFRRMKVTFVSDNFDQNKGFELEYYAILGIDEESELNNFGYYPNPASDYFTLEFESDKVETMECKIVDLSGKIVHSREINHTGGEFNETISVSHLANGIYFLTLTTSTGKAGGKLIINK
ncbi:MAG TPA: C10 family peptidase [Bacteroidales bacterium]|nr:C10 family peptidase [Bacteroidales bacterium]HOH22949.1 C10 family peptidase [Bacteroidales bacterium]HPB57480.1 C10 family peptidase [Bacteroidales bacterium]HPZ03937.1 C10 family peptidase [Bacteroidales bacterium]HQB75487.1 C10 family peptidase [Bacteroidales bacterium]